MPATECPPHEQLASLLSGDETLETAELQSHVDSCNDCQQAIGELRAGDTQQPTPEQLRAENRKRLQDKYGWIAVVVAWILGIVAAEYLPTLRVGDPDAGTPQMIQEEPVQ